MMQSYDPNIAEVPDSEWPPLLRELAAFLSPVALWRLVETYGGTHVSIPTEWDPNCRLAAKLGEDEAKALVHACSGQSLDIPRACGVRRWWRDQVIAREMDQGMTVNEAARRFELTRRQVTNIRGRRPQKNPTT